MRTPVLALIATLLLSGAGCSGASNATDPKPAETAPSDAVRIDVSVGDPLPTDPEMHPLMLGVISGPENISGKDMTDQYRAIGVTSVRNNDYYDDRLDLEQILSCGGATYPSWEGCDAHDDRFYRWTESDAQYAALVDAGFVPFLRLGGEWENASRHHDFKGPQNSAQEQNWITAAIRTTDRYLRWDSKPQAFTYLDIWTEFPGTHFWDRSNVAFVTFFLDAYRQLKAAYPDLKVGGPGFNAGVSMQVLQGKTTVADGLLKEFYEARVRPDWIGWHTFTSDPKTVEQEAAAWQTLLDGTGAFADMPWAGTGFFADTEVIVDAYGNGGSASDTTVPITTSAGAADLTASWIALQNADVQGAFYYRGNEAGDGSGRTSRGKTDEGTKLGLVSASGQLTKGAEAFRLWAAMTATGATLHSASVSGSADSVAVLAAVGSDNTASLLLSNYGEQPVAVRPTVSGRTPSAFSSATVRTVDDAHDGAESSVVTGDEVSVPAHGVALVTLR